MNKLITVASLLFLSFGVAGCSDTNQPTKIVPALEKEKPEPIVEPEVVETEEVFTPEEIAFNESGRAKAIEDETDLWAVYENDVLDIEFKYPMSLTLLEADEYNMNSDQSYIKVEITDPDGEGEDEPLMLSSDEMEETMEALEDGKFGLEQDFPIQSSKKVKALGSQNAQDFMVLSRFEVCDVTLERKFAFYQYGQEVVITIFASKDELQSTMPDYFTVDYDNCGDDSIWDHAKQDEFYTALENGDGSNEIQYWFDSIDQMMDTITLGGGE